MKDLLKSLLPRAVTRWARNNLKKYPFYRNINFDLTNSAQKKILVSYLTDPLTTDFRQSLTHTNTVECNQIITSFINYGFTIDLANCEEKKVEYLKDRKYDVVFGFGMPYYMAAQQNPDAVKILYLTESHPEFSYRQEEERLNYYRQRHGRSAAILRSNMYYKKEYIDVADYGILLGNEHTARTFPELAGRLFTIAPTGLINEKYNSIKRNYRITKKNFVWFGSYGAIHKGLDILIDVFSRLPDVKLFICGLRREESHLFSLRQKNIIDLGFLDISSDEFVKLVNQCSYVILPSCSEGMSTAVLTCMNHGLIPVVTRETGIDVHDSGFYLDDYKIEYVAKVVESCASLDDSTLDYCHTRTYSYARSHFTIADYSRRFNDVMRQIYRITKTL